MDVFRLQQARHAGISQLSHLAGAGSCAPSLFPKAAPRCGTWAQAWLPCQLLAPFSTIYTKTQIKVVGKRRVRPSMAQGGDGDKEHGPKPHQTQWERNQLSAGKGPLLGVYALVPAKATPQNHIYRTNNILTTPMHPAPAPLGSHGPVASRGHVSTGLSAQWAAAGAGPASWSSCGRGKYLLYFLFADFITGSYSQHQ